MLPLNPTSLRYQVTNPELHRIECEILNYSVKIGKLVNTNGSFILKLFWCYWSMPQTCRSMCTFFSEKVLPFFFYLIFFLLLFASSLVVGIILSISSVEGPLKFLWF